MKYKKITAIAVGLLLLLPLTGCAKTRQEAPGYPRNKTAQEKQASFAKINHKKQNIHQNYSQQK